MATQSELRPCKCGSNVLLIEEDFLSDKTQIVCGKCGAKVTGETREEAVLKWNDTNKTVTQVSDEQVVKEKRPDAHWIFLSHHKPQFEIWDGKGKETVGAVAEIVAERDSLRLQLERTQDQRNVLDGNVQDLEQRIASLETSISSAALRSGYAEDCSETAWAFYRRVMEEKEDRLRIDARRLYEALKEARAVLGDAGSDEHLKQLTDAELGRLWTSVAVRADAAIAAHEEMK